MRFQIRVVLSLAIGLAIGSAIAEAPPRALRDAIEGSDMKKLEHEWGKMTPAQVKTALNDAFDYAISKEAVAPAKFLIGKGADIEKKNRDDQTPLFRAAYNGDDKMILMLIDSGAKLNVPCWAYDTSPFYWAVRRSRLTTIKKMLAKGANPSGPNGFRANILHYAARNADVEVLKFFLKQKKWDIDQRNKLRQTPLECAALSGPVESVKLLLDTGATVKGAKGNMNALHYALKRGDLDIKLPKLLIDHKVDVNKNPFLHGTPLYCLLQEHKEDEASFELLIKAGADPQITYHNKTLLHTAAVQGHPKITKRLIQLGLDVNAKNDRKTTPLQYAVWTDEPSPETIQVLMDGGADPSMKGREGKTAFELLAENKNIDDKMRAKLRAILTKAKKKN